MGQQEEVAARFLVFAVGIDTCHLTTALVEALSCATERSPHDPQQEADLWSKVNILQSAVGNMLPTAMKTHLSVALLRAQFLICMAARNGATIEYGRD
jgi:hypothetical protein